MRALVQSKSSWVSEEQPLLKMAAFEFFFNYARINGDTEVTEAISIFRASRDGWHADDFHRLCDDRGATLCLVQSDENYMSAGFTSIAWASPEKATDVEDASACVFALTDKMQVFKTNNPEQAVWHRRDYGPWW